MCLSVTNYVETKFGKMGKHKYIESPEKMWELFVAYVKQTKSKPRIKVEYVGKDGERVDTPLERPLTMEGFENYCADQDVIQDLGHYFANTGGVYEQYCTICSRIKKSIRQDQIEGGMVGQYNSSITQRLNGLTDKTENTNKTEVKILNIDPLDDSIDNSTT